MVLRFVLACGLAAGAMGMTPLTAIAAPGDCPNTPDATAQCVEDPPPPPPPAVRVAMCEDGAFSFTQHTNYQGTCAKHGGVVKWMTGN